MARKRTLLERLTSFLRREAPGGRSRTDEARISLAADGPLALEWATYQARKPEFVRLEGQWVVIHGDQILGVRSSYEEALRLGYERAGYVDFLVHQTLPIEPVHLLPPQPV